ncbi:hypothetical protein BUALT_Bualt04G0078700 [Buddleja alternifolia]|uniref:Uncharacterized protein n=1 Tax=Buddleja alternifolia TaxID=168488 RepID=A0AAV6XYD6_9LAMI|nr:hypothetical protein BUALT_Bualt04G0078700 [Buddleja alternifolia]
MEVTDEECEELEQVTVENEIEETVEDLSKESDNLPNYHVSMNAMTGLHDFRTTRLRMEFNMKGQKVALRGMQPTSIKLIGGKQKNKLLQKPAQISMMHVGVTSKLDSDSGAMCLTSQVKELSTEEMELEQILQEFADIFEEPKSLPPHRDHEHWINLKEGTTAVNSWLRLFCNYLNTKKINENGMHVFEPILSSSAAAAIHHCRGIEAVLQG